MLNPCSVGQLASGSAPTMRSLERFQVNGTIIANRGAARKQQGTMMKTPWSIDKLNRGAVENEKVSGIASHPVNLRSTTPRYGPLRRLGKIDLGFFFAVSSTLKYSTACMPAIRQKYCPSN